MVNPIDIFDLLSDTSEGRRVGFETFLNRFQPGNFQSNVAGRNQGLVQQTNRPFFSNLRQQAESKFFGDQGARIQQQQAPRSFTDFLNNDFDLGRRSRRAPSSQMGTGTSRFSSPARFLSQS